MKAQHFLLFDVESLQSIHTAQVFTRYKMINSCLMYDSTDGTVV